MTKPKNVAVVEIVFDDEQTTAAHLRKEGERLERWAGQDKTRGENQLAAERGRRAKAYLAMADRIESDRAAKEKAPSRKKPVDTGKA